MLDSAAAELDGFVEHICPGSGARARPSRACLGVGAAAAGNVLDQFDQLRRLDLEHLVFGTKFGESRVWCASRHGDSYG